MDSNLARHLSSLGGLARRTQLFDLGLSRHTARTAVASGDLTVPRRGWVATADAPPDAVRSVVLGGRLGGSSALASYGIWVDDPELLVVACPPDSSPSSRLGPSEIRLWTSEHFPSARERAWRVTVLDALLQLAKTSSREELISSIDSAIYTRQLTRADQQALFAALPRRFGNVEKDVDGTSMSGTETRLRLALRAAGYRVRSQVGVRNVGQTDLVVDDWLIVEVDSKSHHGSPEQQAKDRVRDGNAVLSGYGHERFMWSHVRYHLEWCLAVIEQRLSDGRPRRAPVDRNKHFPTSRYSR